MLEVIQMFRVKVVRENPWKVTNITNVRSQNTAQPLQSVRNWTPSIIVSARKTAEKSGNQSMLIQRDAI